MYQRVDVLLDISARLWGFRRIHLNRYAFDADPADHPANGGFEEGFAIPSHEEFNGLDCLDSLMRYPGEAGGKAMDHTLVRTVLPRNSVLCDTRDRSRIEMRNV